jgi:hypothetical protein
LRRNCIETYTSTIGATDHRQGWTDLTEQMQLLLQLSSQGILGFAFGLKLWNFSLQISLGFKQALENCIIVIEKLFTLDSPALSMLLPEFVLLLLLCSACCIKGFNVFQGFDAGLLSSTEFLAHL